MEHTKEPWVAWCKYGWRISGDGERIATLEEIDPDTDEANAHRIAACVNACAGLKPEAILGVVEALREAQKLLQSARREPYSGDDVYQKGD